MANLGFGVTPVHPSELLKLLEKQLQQAGQCTGAAPNPAGCGLGPDAFLSLWPDDLHMKNPRSKRFVAIRPARFPVWQSIVQGSGHPVGGYAGVNTAIGFNAVVTLACFAQINSDPEMRSSDVIAAETVSVTDFVLRVIKSVQFWTPRNAANDQLLREPARMLDGGFGYKPARVGEAWWVPIAVDVELKFTAAFDR